MTYKQAAEFLEVSEKHVKRLAYAKLFPVYRYGHRTVRIDRSDIEKFKRKHRI